MWIKQQRFALVGVVGLVTIASAFLSGCGGDSSSATAEGTTATTAAAELADVPFAGGPEDGVPSKLPPPQEANLTIGLLNPCGATEVCKLMFDGAAEGVEALGGESVELDAQFDPDKQVSQFQQLINQKVDAIAIIPIAEPKLLGPVVEQAAKAGIPLVGMDALPGKPGPLPGFATELWQQRDKMVYLEVKTAAEMLGAGAKVGLIGYALPVPLFNFAEERTEYWAGKFGLDVVEKVESKSDTVEGGQEAAVGLLAQHPEIVGVIGYNDEPAIGAANAAKAAGRDDVKTFGACCGFELGRSGIESGRLTASVFFDATAYGKQTAIAAYDAAQGVELPPEVLAGRLEVLTAESLDQIASE